MHSDFSDIKLVFLDVDGVLTNGTIQVSDHSTSRSYSVLDGMGIKLLLASGIDIVVISGGSGRSITNRLNKLGITNVYTGISCKLPLVQDLLTKYSLLPHQACYLGDDINDLECMTYCGLSFAPQNAHPSVLSAATYTPPFEGGNGFVRHVADLLLPPGHDPLLSSHSFSND